MEAVPTIFYTVIYLQDGRVMVSQDYQTLEEAKNFVMYLGGSWMIRRTFRQVVEMSLNEPA